MYSDNRHGVVGGAPGRQTYSEGKDRRVQRREEQEEKDTAPEEKRPDLSTALLIPVPGQDCPLPCSVTLYGQ